MFEHIERKQGMVEDLQRIEKLQNEIASTAPTMLNHYLQRRSYTKALHFLNHELTTEDLERPTSAHD